eukprot:229627-Pelagomonas_calceolata.AAC.7
MAEPAQQALDLGHFGGQASIGNGWFCCKPCLLVTFTPEGRSPVHLSGVCFNNGSLRPHHPLTFLVCSIVLRSVLHSSMHAAVLFSPRGTLKKNEILCWPEGRAQRGFGQTGTCKGAIASLGQPQNISILLQAILLIMGRSKSRYHSGD